MKHLTTSLILTCSLFIAGCSCFTKPVATITDKPVHIDARLLEPCKKLSEIPDNASFEELLKTSFDNFQIYAECSDRANKLVILVKTFSNKDITK